MPANRSRTVQWRRCLEQIQERNGVLEIAISRTWSEDDGGSHLIWRVRLLEIRAGEIVVEQPVTLGRVIPIDRGTELITIIAVGQNRWMFVTTNLGEEEWKLNARRSVPAMRLVMPERVERCQRRHYYRVETTQLSLPEVDAWPLLDPKSVLVAERANELLLEREQNASPSDGPLPFEDVMPEVGPRFTGLLCNLGGGGVGLRVCPDQSQSLGRHKIFWLRMALPPEMTVPICASAKLVHTHMDSSQHTYAGLAFDFSFNPGHQRVVVDQICRYIAIQQRLQLKRLRKIA